MPQWTDLLIKVERMEREYGSSPRNPASDIEIQKLNHTIKQKVGNIQLPDPYVKFLKKVNGLDFNGLVIYGVDEDLLEKEVDEHSHGLVKTNELWYENDWKKQYLFFGDSDTAWYGYDRKENIFVELDKPSGTLIQSFESFDSMLVDAFETVL
ncbi:YrhA family protein [Rossellomorea vietnamensis]|uniref:YrhA family protein n=1 Tax=Rossellomorea vietnamensis TaxID=218284 RepID=UPI001E52BE8E|nr:YrhA family protein [Rossellomorea vietnamensis]MCC5803894.1 SMI1/KNR4 family protein [Rossellomorea vietnamensis]